MIRHVALRRLGRPIELGAVQIGVEAPGAQQLIVATLFDDAAFVDHDDPVGGDDRRQSVRDDQRRATGERVGERGYRMSGGEKQRLAIARMLLKDPAVVILDEATSHLDSESELAIQHALADALVGRTSLVIAHRLSTIVAADRILVLEDGRIMESGSHDDLLRAGGLYTDLYQTQFDSSKMDEPTADAG